MLLFYLTKPDTLLIVKCEENDKVGTNHQALD